MNSLHGIKLYIQQLYSHSIFKVRTVVVIEQSKELLVPDPGWDEVRVKEFFTESLLCRLGCDLCGESINVGTGLGLAKCHGRHKVRRLPWWVLFCCGNVANVWLLHLDTAALCRSVAYTTVVYSRIVAYIHAVTDDMFSVWPSDLNFLF
jgi:hypothetical protein